MSKTQTASSLISVTVHTFPSHYKTGDVHPKAGEKLPLAIVPGFSRPMTASAASMYIRGAELAEQSPELIDELRQFVSKVPKAPSKTASAANAVSLADFNGISSTAQNGSKHTPAPTNQSEPEADLDANVDSIEAMEARLKAAKAAKLAKARK